MSPSPARIRSTLATLVDQPDELRAIRVFHKALADVNRLRIVQRLAGGTASVNELMQHLFSPRAWGSMAESETYAHLEHLRLGGQAGARWEDDLLLYEVTAG